MSESVDRGINSTLDNSEDPYKYLDRDDFTSEKYKIEIRGLPKYYGIGEFKRFLNEKLKLNTNKIKPPKKGGSWLYVCFRSEECRKKAIEIINGITWKQRRLSAQAANPAPDPFVKRKLENHKENAKKQKLEEEESKSPEDRVKDSTIPLWNLPYKEQLELKQKEMIKVISQLCQEISKKNRDAEKVFSAKEGFLNGLKCDLQAIAHSDKTIGYRNKCEFTVGRDITGSQKMIGFRLSSYASGSIAVGPIDDLIHIPEQMKKAVKIFEKFVENSDLDVFDPVNQTGHWRQVTARCTTLNNLMLIIGIHPQKMTDDEKGVLKNQLKEFFDENAETGVTSLYFQTIDKKTTGSEGGGCIEYISGTPYIEEELLGMRFRISPDAFFQVNSAGAEILYKKAIELSNPDSDTALLDICCGTGTIGLCFAKYSDEVFGIEVIESAIKDAKENARVNNITNCEFFAGKAEDIIIPVIQRSTKKHIIAVVDPPRAGLHHKVLLALRKATKLKKLVYISCDPKAAMQNLIDLARPNSKHYHGEPLIPVKAVAVDMFPYTRHCELIIYLERLSAMQMADKISE